MRDTIRIVRKGRIVEIDEVGPTAEITRVDPNPTGEDVLHFRVLFNESVLGTFTPSVISLTGTLAASITVGGTDPDYVVTVTMPDPNADGVSGISIGAGVTDLLGTPYAGGASPLYDVTNWPGYTLHPVGGTFYSGVNHVLSVGVAGGPWAH